MRVLQGTSQIRASTPGVAAQRPLGASQVWEFNTFVLAQLLRLTLIQTDDRDVLRGCTREAVSPDQVHLQYA